MSQERIDKLRKCKEFTEEIEKFTTEIDPILKGRQFEGPELEVRTKDFFKKHQNFIESFPFKYSHFRFPRCGHSETIEEDLRILVSVEKELKEEEEKKKNKKNGKSSPDDEDDEKEILEAARKSVAIFYARASAAAYLRLTFNKSRFNKEQDRREPLDFVRHAIRYEPSDYYSNYWYMITSGWHCDTMKNPKERISLGRCFHQAILNSSLMDPKDGLPYHLMGRFHYSIASLSWIERTISNKLLGGNFESSYQEAEQELLRSHATANWLPNCLWLARVLLAQHRPMDEVKKYIDFGLTLEVNEPTTEIDKRDLLELRSKLKLASEES